MMMERSEKGSDQVSAGTRKDGVETRTTKMKVMVAIDESEGSFYALKWALHNLTAPSVGTPAPDKAGSAAPEATLKTVGMLFLVHVQPSLHEYVYPVGPAVMDSVKKAQENRSAGILSRALEMCKDKLVKAETMIVTGDAREMICEAAEQVHADLLVLGSRGLGKLSRTFLGSVSDYCAHHAKTPVLIVKPPMKESEKK
ncbi:universal stress protein A-like protein [Senna tora]|uniref:Universal stress protein A-like protein n=1 Tax=Senna tora TaxID=362788 RepID=A0A834TB97_9FABA|nr:universal stress protein A-like protein [Senna tora]